MRVFVYGFVVAAVYLTLQISVFSWRSPIWRVAGQLPLWGVGALTVLSVVLSALGVRIAPVILGLSVPMITAYLICLWLAYLCAHRTAATA